MDETGFGFAKGALARSGDEFLCLPFEVKDDFDLGAVLGASPAPTKRHEAVRNALLVELLLLSWRDQERWLAYSRDRNFYPTFKRYFGSSATYAKVLWAVESLIGARLVEHRKSRPSPKGRYRSTLRATIKLVELSPVSELSQFRNVIAEPVRLKDADRQLMQYPSSSETRLWRRDAHEQNEALRGLSISFEFPGWTADGHGLLHNDARVLNLAHHQCYRVFNRDWEHGGRWFGTWWQGLGSNERASIRINGEASVEIDYDYLRRRC